MKTFIMQFSANNKNSKIEMTVNADSLINAESRVRENFNVTAWHKCKEIKPQTENEKPESKAKP